MGGFIQSSSNSVLSALKSRSFCRVKTMQKEPVLQFDSIDLTGVWGGQATGSWDAQPTITNLVA